MIKIWHFSDTHSHHEKLNPPDCDIDIFSGDGSNSRISFKNEKEVMNLLDWYGKRPTKYKIFIGGNHDVSIERGLINIQQFIERGIIYLENDWTEVLGLKIWGSPITPSFGSGWAWNKERHKIYQVWSHIPEDTDIIITHGPPKGFLDLSYNHSNHLERCGCSVLAYTVQKIKPKLVCFGHIHNCKDIVNSGVLQIKDLDGSVITYSNGTVVKDGMKNDIISHGNIIIL